MLKSVLKESRTVKDRSRVNITGNDTESDERFQQYTNSLNHFQEQNDK